MIIFVVKGEPFQIRSQPTESQNKKDWFEVNKNQAFLAKFDNSLGLSACCVGTRHVTKLRCRYSLYTGITSVLDTVNKITGSNYAEKSEITVEEENHVILYHYIFRIEMACFSIFETLHVEDSLR